MTIQEEIETIAQHYNENQVLYDIFWSGDAVHYGIWDPDTGAGSYGTFIGEK